LEGLNAEEKKKVLKEEMDKLNNIKEKEKADEEEEESEESGDTIIIKPDENILNKVDIFEDSIERNLRIKEEEERRQKLYEQNRANMRERMRRLKKFIRENIQYSQNTEDFFKKHKKYFEEYKVSNYSELLLLLYNYDLQNPDEVEREKRERFLEKLKIEHVKGNDLTIIPEIKIFSNLNMSNSKNGIIYINKYKYFKKIEKCKTNEYKFIPDILEYLAKISKKYEINKTTESFMGIEKIKYDESELNESSNINITIKRTSKNEIEQMENYTENGIPIDELRNRKINKLLKNLSEEDSNNYEKVKEIIGDLNNKNCNSSILENIFCLNCNKCFKPNESHSHSNHLTIKIDTFNDFESELNDLDYNASLNKLYENLKKDQNKILKNGNEKLIIYYNQILFYLYEIIINNNSIEDLNTSIININEDYNKEKESETFNEYFKDYFLFYVKMISQLTYFKEKKIEKLLVDLEYENNKLENITLDTLDGNTNNYYSDSHTSKINKRRESDDYDEMFSPKINEKLDKNKIKQYNEKDKKKYFLKLGLKLKFQNGKKESITELYSDARKQNINPLNYENFIIKGLAITKGQN